MCWRRIQNKVRIDFEGSVIVFFPETTIAGRKIEGLRVTASLLWICGSCCNIVFFRLREICRWIGILCIEALLKRGYRVMSWAGPDTFPGTSLADNLDKKLVVILRDGRKLIGILRSFDQFANVVLENSVERVIVGELFCDLPLGLYIIRGENVVLIGELDPMKDDLPPHMMRVTPKEIEQAQKVEREATELKGTMRKRMEFLDLD